MRDLPRIDTAERQLRQAIDLLTACLEELGDLHALAYERRTATPGDRVRVSVTDWALDTHGSPKARAAYRRLLGATLAAAEPIYVAALDVIAILREGERARRYGPRVATAAEVMEAIAMQAKRLGRGEYTPVRRVAQPEP